MDEQSKKDILRSLKENPQELIKIMKMYDPGIESISSLEEIENFFFPKKEIVERKSSVHKCKKCKGNNILIEQHQMRASDEGATTIYTCRGCSNSWNN